MPRVKAVNPNIKLHVALRPETVAKLRIYFASEDDVTGLIRGAVSKFIDVAVNEKFERLANETSSKDPVLQSST